MRQTLLLFYIFYVAASPFLFYTILDRRGLTNMVLYAQRYIHIILRSGCIAHGIPFPPHTPSSFFLFFSSFVSVLLLLAASLVHVVPWPTSCQPSQLASAPGNFSFRIKLHGISRLPSFLFLVFLPFSLPDLSLKLWSRNIRGISHRKWLVFLWIIVSMRSLIRYEICNYTICKLPNTYIKNCIRRKWKCSYHFTKDI